MKKQVKDLVSGDVFREIPDGNVLTVQRITIYSTADTVEVEATSPAYRSEARMFYDPTFQVEILPQVSRTLPPPEEGWDIDIKDMSEDDRPTLRPTGDETLGDY